MPSGENTMRKRNLKMPIPKIRSNIEIIIKKIPLFDVDDLKSREVVVLRF